MIYTLNRPLLHEHSVLTLPLRQLGHHTVCARLLLLGHPSDPTAAILKPAALNHRVEHSLRPCIAPIGSPVRFSWAISEARDRDEKVKKSGPKAAFKIQVTPRPAYARSTAVSMTLVRTVWKVAAGNL